MWRKGKSEDKLFAFNKIFYELKKNMGYVQPKNGLKPNTTVVSICMMHQVLHTSHCYAFDLTRLAKEGLFFLEDITIRLQKHFLTTFLDDVIEFVSFMSNRSSGAEGCQMCYYGHFISGRKIAKKKYYLKDPDYYIRQSFQKFIYRLNQPFLRVDQSAFVNVSIFDKPYLEALFGGVEFPDGTFCH